MRREAAISWKHKPGNVLGNFQYVSDCQEWGLKSDCLVLGFIKYGEKRDPYFGDFCPLLVYSYRKPDQDDANIHPQSFDLSWLGAWLYPRAETTIW